MTTPPWPVSRTNFTASLQPAHKRMHTAAAKTVLLLAREGEAIALHDLLAFWAFHEFKKLLRDFLIV